MKSFAVAAALDAYGSAHTFDTPVHRVGDVSGGVLAGDLVLVGSGDLSFGLRQEPDGSLSYETMPALDHSYATIGIPGAVMPSGDPVAIQWPPSTGASRARRTPRRIATRCRSSVSIGTLGNVLSDSPVAGAALLKTGNRAVGTPAGQMILLGNSLAGYVEGASGRPFTVMIAMANMPFRTMDEFLSVTDDQAAMVAAMRDAF